MVTVKPHPQIKRSLDIGTLLGEKSHLLLGPRQTGKTTLIRRQLPEAVVYD